MCPFKCRSMAVLLKRDEDRELACHELHVINRKSVSCLQVQHIPGNSTNLILQMFPAPSVILLPWSLTTTTTKKCSPTVLNVGRYRLAGKAWLLVLHCLSLHLLFVHCVTLGKFLNVPVPLSQLVSTNPHRVAESPT